MIKTIKEKAWVEGHYSETGKEIIIPQMGDKIYVNPFYYIDHEEDDFDGGICEINKVELYKDCLPCNRIMIGVEEHPHGMFNYINLLKLKQNITIK